MDFFHLLPTYTSFPIALSYVSGSVFTMRMSSHKPLSMPSIMLIYNAVAIVLSTVTAAMFLHSMVFNSEKYLLLGLQIFWASKIVELLDTFFMLVRRKYDQVSFLHVYHHSSMMLLTEWIWRYHPIAHAAVPSFLNSTVHIVMYTYYALSAINVPCPWKIYLTQFQLTQFGLLILHAIYGYFTYEESLFAVYGVYEVSMLVLFLSFYMKSYVRGDRKEKKSE